MRFLLVKKKEDLKILEKIGEEKFPIRLEELKEIGENGIDADRFAYNQKTNRYEDIGAGIYVGVKKGADTLEPDVIVFGVL